MKLTFEEAVEELENGSEVTLEIDGHSYEISQSDNWIGGENQDGYISLALGNVIYDSAEVILRKSINFLEEDGGKVTITM